MVDAADEIARNINLVVEYVQRGFAARMFFLWGVGDEGDDGE